MISSPSTGMSPCRSADDRPASVRLLSAMTLILSVPRCESRPRAHGDRVAPRVRVVWAGTSRSDCPHEATWLPATAGVWHTKSVELSPELRRSAPRQGCRKRHSIVIATVPSDSAVTWVVRIFVMLGMQPPPYPPACWQHWPHRSFELTEDGVVIIHEITPTGGTQRLGATWHAKTATAILVTFEETNRQPLRLG